MRKDLESLFFRAESVDQASEIAGDLNRLLCVRVCGFLERSVVSALKCLCESSSFGAGQAFALSWLERAPNPSADAIVGLVARFDAGWADDLRNLLDSDERRARLNALVGIRNDISHGKNQGVSRTQAWAYYELANELVDWLLERFDPVPTAVAG